MAKEILSITLIGLACLPFAAHASEHAGSTRRLERDTASLLYQYASVVAEKGGDVFENFTPQDPYILGYLHFKKGDEAKAKPFFEKAIEEGTFPAPSRYLLASMLWKQHKADEKRDVKKAYSLLEEAIAYDPEYSSPYYLRGTMRWAHDHKADQARDDLAKAVGLSLGSCYRIHDPKELPIFERLDTKQPLPGLAAIQKECAKAHGLEEKVKHFQAK